MSLIFRENFYYRKKFQNDLINQERYADNIHIYILRRKYFRKLILNCEMNNIAKTFLIKINQQCLKKVNCNFNFFRNIFRY